MMFNTSCLTRLTHGKLLWLANYYYYLIPINGCGKLQKLSLDTFERKSDLILQLFLLHPPVFRHLDVGNGQLALTQIRREIIVTAVQMLEDEKRKLKFGTIYISILRKNLRKSKDTTKASASSLTVFFDI